MRYFILFLLFVAGCQTPVAERFTLPQGEAIECYHYEQTPCGMALEYCGSEHTVEFYCMQDVHYVGHADPTPSVPADRAPATQEGEVGYQ